MSLRSAIPAQGAKSFFREFPKDLEGRLVCKKSGKLVKSSLKSSKSATRNSLSVVTFPQSSKSEPSTPSQKAVHFDSQLEHVKLFLAEQKPLAVSRDGSPTDDTSGTDSDFPRFIYGDDDRNSRKKLHMHLCNMPCTINLNSDVVLQSLSLTPDGKSILGRVRVRNIAFFKCVAIRFTFDSWQTTSEVLGRYVESTNSEFDKFSFTIRLHDLLTRIEDKTLVMAIRYSVAGQDFWDNNNGQNYMATFTMTKVEPEATPTLSDQETPPDIADLRNKLEKMSQSEDRTGPAFLAEHSRRQSTPADLDTTCFRTSPSFGSRYDFAASMGSPRDISPIRQQRAVDDNIQPYTPRNHRRGYFDLTSAKRPRPIPAALRRPPPETPTGCIPKVSNAAFHPSLGFSSFSPMHSSSRSISPYNGDSPNFNLDKGGDSELSTPSLFTPSSSRTSTPSPTDGFMSPLSCDENAQSLSPDTHYRQLINKFCFFTGQGGFFGGTTVDAFPRTQSVSDIEELLSGISPRLPFTTTLNTPSPFSTSPVSPTRSSSLDDLKLNRSGSLTPTVSRLALMSASASAAITISASVSVQS